MPPEACLLECEQLTDCYLIGTSPCGIHVVLDDSLDLR
ncbi:hypothetical protein PORUE0001_1151 [Porphyromonas uenonis 60-3]|uniref:Uncharacterized protein n=1 Tax=Porphyromonas uenonis 60-3 TaxID=596327 RepID=C2MAL8_9PORP|nr:hypothetical protein PORUE0001_1151 [Porphyromonas uenonis 60-3]